MNFDFRAELGKMTPKIAEGAKIYVFGAGRYWENICKEYRYLVDFDINSAINGFIDNDPKKQGSIYYGKRVFSISDIDKENAVILTSVGYKTTTWEILSQLLSYGFYHSHSVFDVGIHFNILMCYSFRKYEELRDKHKGERCFIIGNGPSLQHTDLDKLKDEITFATNRIFHIFDKTTWRPSYYICEEDMMFTQIQNEIATHIECPAFYSRRSILDVEGFQLKNFYYFHQDFLNQCRPIKKPKFSEEPFIIYHGHTVTYSALQIAAYMGFDEIYLLGVDNTFKRGVKINGELVFSGGFTHFSEDYRITEIYSSHFEEANNAYAVAREYAESNGIKIYNATRGGALEVFERVSFDDLF